MDTFSALLALGAGNSPVTGEFPYRGQRRGALMFSLICVRNKWLSKQSWGWWFEMTWRSLWRHCNVCHEKVFQPHSPSQCNRYKVLSHLNTFSKTMLNWQLYRPKYKDSPGPAHAVHQDTHPIYTALHMAERMTFINVIRSDIKIIARTIDSRIDCIHIGCLFCIWNGNDVILMAFSYLAALGCHNENVQCNQYENFVKMTFPFHCIVIVWNYNKWLLS